jgi:hypothetical protein
VDQGDVWSRRDRLAEVERRIDRAGRRSAAARDDTRARVEPRLRSLRDQADRGISVAALEAEVSVVDALLDLDDAGDTDGFIRAARRVLRAYRARLDVLRSEPTGTTPPSSEVGTAEGLITVAEGRLDGFEGAVTLPGPSRTRVLVALDDLDRSCRAAVAAGDAERGTDAS